MSSTSRSPRSRTICTYLEQAYGTALFQHNGKRPQLTEAGEILRRTLMTMKHDEQHLQKRMQQVVSGTRDYSFGATPL